MADTPTTPCGNNDCDKCDPKPRWRIRAHRVQHITYEREIKAATAEEALRIFDGGTAWPSAYDDHYGEVVQQDPPVITLITGEDSAVDALKLADYREDCCWHDLPSKLEAAGLGHLDKHLDAPNNHAHLDKHLDAPNNHAHPNERFDE